MPQPVPSIPTRPLWIALAVPPLATVFANLILAHFGPKHAGSLLSLLVPPLVLWTIFTLAVVVHQSISRRYRGPTLIFLNVAYILGQIIVCLALWFGSCVLFMR